MKTGKIIITILIVLVILVGVRAIRRGHSEVNEPPQIPENGENCNGDYNAGYRILNEEKQIAIWYPTQELAEEYSYGNANGLVSFESEIADCGPFPVILFSHGYGGCGTQSVFLTEELARKGYVVLALDHKDALCSIDGDRSESADFDMGVFRNPSEWNSETFADRKEDIEFLLNKADELNSALNFKNSLDTSKIGFAGHSLGGYTGLGLAGGWESWKNNRIKAFMLMSPYSEPYIISSDLSKVDVPVMLQGGTLDIGITPTLDEVYSKLTSPKFFLTLKLASHMAWTNKACSDYANSFVCVNEDTKAESISNYGIAFFDKYLKNENTDSVLKNENSALKYYEYEF